MSSVDQAAPEIVASKIAAPATAAAKTRFTFRLRVEHVLTAGTVIGLFALWTLLSRYKLVHPLFLPAPEVVWKSFVEVLTSGYQGKLLHEHMAASLGRIFAGYLTACVIGIPLGLLMGLSTRVKAVFDPIVEFYRPLPPLALYTLLVMWLGIGDTSKVALLFLAALPPLSISAMQAARSIDIGHIRAAQMLGATRTQLFRHVFLPSCLPGICTGMRISLGFTYTVLVASEIVAATAGVGWMIWDASKFLLSDVVIMGLFVLGLTGLLLDWFIRQLERLITPWRFI
jgi:taurine transport system permease protein